MMHMRSGSDNNNEENYNQAEHKINLLKQKYRINPALNSSQSKSWWNSSPKNQLAKLLELTGKERVFLENLKTAIKKYARENLNQVGTGDNYTVQEMNVGTSTVVAKAKTTNEDRAKAINLLFDIVKSSSTREIYEYVTMASFQDLIGTKEWRLNPFRQYLSEVITSFIKNYKSFLDDTSDEVILNILLDKTVRQSITEQTLTKLFWSYNSKLVADIIVNFYQNRLFSSPELTPDFLQKLLNDDKETIEYINEIRCTMSAALILPTDAITPGKNPDEEMTKFQLFQYDDLTIYAVEQWLREKFKNLLANNIYGLPNYEKKAKEAPYFFYQISAAYYMLIDPKQVSDNNYYRYQSFKDELRSLLDSYDPIERPLNKPILFFGLINFSGTHYIPYFIHKTLYSNYQIITVDPSPLIYPPTAQERDGTFKDGKMKARGKIAEIFRDILPGCKVYDPDVAQMLKERDCGPNSATTLFDALRTCLYEKPLLVIENDSLQINSEQLTIQHQPVGFNPYTGTYVYSTKLEQETIDNRDFWRNELVNVTKVRPLTQRKNLNTAITIDDFYDINDQIEIEYSYIDQVETQNHQDKRETNISAIQSLLLAHAEGREIRNQLIVEYKQTLELPNPTLIVDFVKTKITSQDELTALTTEHNNSLEELANDVTGVLLREHIAQALVNVFDSQVLENITPSFDLVADVIVDAFLKENKLIFQKLSIYQQRLERNMLLEHAIKVVDNKLIECHLQRIKSYLNLKCRFLLTKIDPNLTNDAFVKGVITIIFIDNNVETADIKESIKFLSAKASDKLKELFLDSIHQTLKTVISASVDKICNALQVNQKTLSEILSYFSHDNGRFNPLSIGDLTIALNRLDQSLFNDVNNQILQYREIYSILGKRVLFNVNDKLRLLLSHRLSECIKDSVNQFFSQPAFQNKFFSNQSTTYLSSLLNNHWRLLPDAFSQDTLQQILKTFGNEFSLTPVEFSHYLVNKLATQYLLDGFSTTIRKKIEEYFEKVAHSIFDLPANKEFLSTFNVYIEVNKIEELTTALYSNYISDPLTRKFFTENFLEPGTVQLGHFNSFGERFHHWFKVYKIDSICKNMAQIKHLKNNINNSLQLIDKLIELLEDKVNLVPSITDVKLIFTAYDQQLNRLSLIDDFQQVYQAFINQYVKTTDDFLRKVYENFKPNDSIPGSFTSLARSIFCAWLGIDTPYILTKNQIKKVDEKIKQILQKDFFSLDLNVRGDIHLLPLKAIKTLESNYGKPLTRQLLIDCISFWFGQTTFSFDLNISQLWFKNNDLPPLIKKLIEIINDFPEAKEDILADNLPDLDFFNNAKSSELTIYNSSDLLNKIKSALTKTSTLSNTKPTKLQYSDILKHLALKLPAETSAKNNNNSKPVVEVSAQMIQQKTLEKIRLLKNQNLHAEINLSKIREEVVQELNVSSKQEEFSIEPVNVQTAELKMNGFLSVFSFLGAGLTSIEKKLELLKYRHDNQIDFYLDQRDVDQLKKLLKNRWLKLIEQKRKEELAAEHYLENPDRKDKVYIASAEILSAAYRRENIKLYPYELLMPGYNRFPSAVDYIKEDAHCFPKFICKQYHYEQADTSIADIPIANLIIIDSGYALDMDWILNFYQKEEQLLNFYTEQLFSKADLDHIAQHKKFVKLFNLIKAKTYNCITERGINLLVDYLNEAIYDKGFGSRYSTAEENRANKAFEEFRKIYSTLPSKEQRMIDSETIPGAGKKTIGEVFDNSAIFYESKGRSVADTCLTLNGVSLAKVVLAYKGNNHGLENAHLVSDAKQGLGNLVNSRNNKPDQNKLNDQEKYLLELGEARQLDSNVSLIRSLRR